MKNARFRCILSALGIALLPALASTPAAAASACHPMLSTRDGMLSSVSSIGVIKRMGELCQVPKSATEQKAGEDLAMAQPCLTELGVKAQEIQAALQRGAASADDVYAKSEDKARLCEAAREEY